jgi:hypothetical protein
LKRKIVIISIAAIALIVAFVTFYFLTGDEEGVKYETYVNENYHFKFDYPAEWDIEVLEDNVVIDFDPAYENAIVPSPLSPAKLIVIVRWDRICLSVSENVNLVDVQANISIDNVPAEKHVLEKYSEREDSIIRAGTLVAVKDNYAYKFEVIIAEKEYPESIFEHVIDSFSFLD